MSRTDIPTDRPLSEKDRAYLLMRGENSRVEWFDATYPADSGEEDTGGTAATADDQEPTDDYDKWTVDELKGRVQSLNEDGAEITPASTKKADLIAALREYDALPDEEE